MSEINSLAAKQKWQITGYLFKDLDRGTVEALRGLPDILQKVWPLNTAHRGSLAQDIHDLSEILTCSRAELRRPYWSASRHVSAYLYYFLPWNIIRLCRLFAGLKLPEPTTGDKMPLLLDAGSGPLTVALALWLAKPQWRSLPIKILALDSQRRPLLLGKQIFNELAAASGQKPWQIFISHAPLAGLVTETLKLGPEIQPWLVTCANTLNEVMQAAQKSAHGAATDQQMLAEKFLTGLTALAGRPNLLFVEPGTRLGSAAIEILRCLALELGYRPLSPCTHDRACPFMDEENCLPRRNGGWCHFTFAANNVPDWLSTLSIQAGLRKQALSLSFLLLAADAASAQKKNDPFATRVLSQSFAIKEGTARYACSAHGLSLLKNADNCPSGSLTLACASQTPKKDARSGAVILQPYNDRNNEKNSWRRKIAKAQK